MLNHHDSFIRFWNQCYLRSLSHRFFSTYGPITIRYIYNIVSYNMLFSRRYYGLFQPSKECEKPYLIFLESVKKRGF